jgi:hypothetical protein
MKRKCHVVKIGDPQGKSFLRDLEGVFIPSFLSEKYRIDMLQEDGQMRIRTLILIIPAGSEICQ